MSTTRVQSQTVARRAELLAELFLQELEPEFLVRPTTDLTYDLLAGFRNAKGGINNIAVEVKSTERLTGEHYSVSRDKYELWANSNIPVLLLVVDVKKNQLYYHWPSNQTAGSEKAHRLQVPLSRIDSAATQELKRRLCA